MATRYPLSALAFPCVTMLWLSSQMSVSLTTAAGSKHMAILSNVNCTLSSSCMTDRRDTDKFYRLVEIAETIMGVTRPNNSNKLRNMSNNYNNRRDRNVLYPETPGNATNSSVMMFRMDKQDFSGEEVTSAVLKIYIKTKGKRRRRRIILHVSENTADGNLAEFATIKLRVKRKGWQKINLPVYLLTRLQHQPIKLHVGCEKCNKKVRVVLPLKKSKKSQELRDLGSRKRRSPIIVLNTKPNTAAVASAVATRRLRRPRRDIFRFGSRDAAGPSIVQTAAEMSAYATPAKQLHVSLTNDGIVDKSPTVIQRNDRRVRDADRNVLKRDETTRFTGVGSGTTQVNINREDEKKSFSGNNIYSNDDDNHNSSFEYDDDDDDDDYDDDEDDDDDDENEDEVGLNDEQIADEDEGLNKGCCIKSRFVSFRSIGLNGLVVRPRLGFVSNQCSDRCPTDHLHVTRPPREDVSAVATHKKWDQQAIPYRKKSHGIPEYADQPENRKFLLEKNRGKSLPEKLKNSPNSGFKPEEVRVRSSFPLLAHFRHLFRDTNHRIHQHREQDISYGRWDSEDNNDTNNRNSNSDKNKRKRAKEKYNPNKKKKNLLRRRSCRPVAYKNLNLSFITADLKIEKMTLPDAIVSKCGYV